MTKKTLYWLRYSLMMLLFAVMWLLGTGAMGVLVLVFELIGYLFFDVTVANWFNIASFFPFFPVAYWFRYQLKIDMLWAFMNDTKDGDFGDAKWKRKKGIPLEKENFWIGLKWWLRNHSRNFIYLFSTGNPKEKDVEMIVNTVINADPKNYMDWPNRDAGKYGKLLCYYPVNGKLHARYGIASERFELQMGSAGERYKFRMKIGKA